ncbi:metal-dependent hydrolase [Haloarcula onubensis]|uniref:Metal-dependent hydrolase n=1 Tax=Haloarcula onubensis TaxID=2950539 RepID=A0ABU2FLN2_9EURY|nr:metal-dependent hydrolase [Halomicroarcula sp. S3CR25-11]MDS0281679.1 metal-dependent hydrolase [Halomicroarcula sp. S3CR25-11]
MYRLGHQGAALVAYAPLGLALLVAARPTLAVVGGGVSLALASVPDVDQRLPGVAHRGVTHTLGFALAVGVGLGAAGWLLGRGAGVDTAAEFAAVGFAVGTTVVVSHLLADVITPMGITPFWPVSDRHYTLDICRADNAAANYALLGLGIAVTVAVLAVAPR